MLPPHSPCRLLAAFLFLVLIPPLAAQTGTKPKSDGPSPLDRLESQGIPSLERFDWQPKELVAVMGEHRGRQGGTVSSVAWSRDGRLIASGGSSGLVRLWDPKTMVLRELLGHSSHVYAIAFDPATKRLAAAGSDGTIRLWDVSGPKSAPGPLLKASSTALYALAFSPDGNRLVVGGHDTTIYLFDLSEPKPGNPTTIPTGKGEITGLAFAPRGDLLYSSDNGGLVRLWDMTGAQPTERSQFEAHPKGVACLAIDLKGQTLATGSADGTIATWRLGTGKPARAGQVQHAGGVRALAFSPGGGTLASAGNDRTTVLWDLTKSPPVKRAVCEGKKGPFDGHIGAVQAVAFDPQGRELVTGGADWTVRIWSLVGTKPSEPEQKTVTRGHLSHVYTIAFAPDGQTLASGSYDGTTRVWTLAAKEPKERSLLRGDSSAIYATAFSPDGRWLVSGGASATFRLWDALLGLEKRRFQGLPSTVNGLAFTPDGKQVLCTSGKELWLYDAADATKVLRRFEGHTERINSAALSPDGKRALSGAGYYEYKNGIPVLKNGKYVYLDCTLRLWDLESGKELHAVQHEAPFARVAFLPNGRALTSAWDSVNYVWSLEGGKPKEVGGLQGKPGYATLFAPSPDGERLATAWSNGRLILWDVDTGKALQDWAFPETMGGLAYAPDGRHLAVALRTGVIYVLRLPR